MAKLSLKADPTFSASAPIPVAGKPDVDVQFTFVHRDRKALNEYLEWLKALTGESLENDVAIMQKVASGWELDEAFTPEFIEQFVSTYHGAAWAVAQTYIRVLMGAKLGN